MRAAGTKPVNPSDVRHGLVFTLADVPADVVEGFWVMVGNEIAANGVTPEEAKRRADQYRRALDKAGGNEALLVLHDNPSDIGRDLAKLP